MSDVVIRAENLGKKYRIHHQQERQRYVALRDVFADKLLTPWRWAKRQSAHRQSVEDFWALKDVSFEIKQGEVVGIIGRNGAGKSTLLKILSRITEPTEGRVKIRGRVASLLEVGTGFHPELTGRENIYLNGAILGMTKLEIKQKFDEIVSFAEIDQFLDTPVKRYSSGMYVRLAFAVAAHLEPEILVVDEVLAVGDIAFQKKCLGKMSEVADSNGKTVIFVSHNMEAIGAMCESCMLLQYGQLVLRDNAANVIACYLDAANTTKATIDLKEKSTEAYFCSAKLCNENGNISLCFQMSERVILMCHFQVRAPQPGLEVALAVLNSKRERIFYSSNKMAEVPISIESAGNYAITASIPSQLLLPGRYFINLALHRPNVQLFDYQENILSFEVIQTEGEISGFPVSSLGYVYANVIWHAERVVA
ncbi:MAG TPA: ABC transporter ATP-binding protein [Blastocatellia bacterium]|nr:ABC transporter ATP-binding protein [Blastocatellia bacterium]